MRRTLVLFGVLAAFATPPATAAEYSRGDWRGWSYPKDATGEFEGCTIARETSSGERLQFFLYFDNAVAFGLLNFVFSIGSPSLRLTRDQSYPATILVDGNGIGAEKKVAALDPDMVMATLPYSNEIFETLGNGGVLSVRIQQEKLSFPLKGVANALDWLRNCTEKGFAEFWRNRGQSGAPPPPPKEPEKILPEAMAMLLDRAGLPEYVLDSPGLRGENIDHEWKWGGIGGMQFYTTKAGDKFADVFADLVSFFASKCTGSPNPTMQTASFGNGAVYARSTFHCPNEPIGSRYAILAIDQNKHMLIVIHTGVEPLAEDVATADQRVFGVFRDIYK